MITVTPWSGDTFLARTLRRLSRNERGSMSVLIAIGLRYAPPERVQH